MTNATRSPDIDPARHLDDAALAAAFAALPNPPRERGTLDGLIVRLLDGAHQPLDAITLSPERGIHEDRWTGRDGDAPVAMMETGVARLFANGQPLSLFGDNLFVDLDLSGANTPVGARIRVGSAILEVSAEPHTACSTFRKRFGVEAARFSGRDPARQLRGLFLHVVAPGAAALGDVVEVVSGP